MRGTIIIMCLLLIPAFAYADVNLNISDCTTEIIDSDTIKLNKVTGSVDGVPAPGQYWIEFDWDPVGLVFVPVDIGQELVPTSKTWSWTVSGFFYSFRYTLTSNPFNRTFAVSYQHIFGTPFICQSEDFIQGNNIFDVDDDDWDIDETTALIDYSGAFDGCGNIYIGQTLTATISRVPSWFDFNKSFMVSWSDGEPMVCEPDGTVHK